MSKFTYAQIEKELPIVVKASLLKMDDIQRAVFAEEYSKKRKSILTAYLFVLLYASHRWYISGRAGLTLIQWLLLLINGIGLIWVLIDLFFIPGMCRNKNEEIAKNVLAEQKILSSK